MRRPEFDYIAEQVSHHPPISAGYATNRNKDYEFWLNSYIKTSFWGTSFAVSPIGFAHIKLNNFNELYSIERPTTIVHNIIMGQMYIAHEGTLSCKRTKLDGSQIEEDKIDITFCKTGWSASERCKFEGNYESDSRKYKIFGKWNEGIWLEDV